MKKICIVTGTRAEWGLLSRLAAGIKDDKALQLQLIATNMHLSPEFGLTYKEIEQEGFTIDRKVEMLLSSDTPNATTKSVGLATIGFGDAYEELKPDIILVLGDRYEILAAVTAALFYKIPVVHLHGGEITEGAYDNSIRHAITKMSHLHFASTEEYRQRIIQMGELPETVFNVGAIGIDNIRQIALMDKAATEESLGGFILDRNTWLVTYHPETLEYVSVEKQFESLLEALDCFPEQKIIFTMPNSDTGGRILQNMIKQWVARNPARSTFFTSLGLKRYLSVLQYIGAVVGNSSSGIIEVPSFGIYTLNIGDRQKGRIAAASVLHCSGKKEDIQDKLHYISKAILTSPADNPYERKNTAGEIIRILKNHIFTIQKSFYTIPK